MYSLAASLKLVVSPVSRWLVRVCSRGARVAGARWRQLVASPHPQSATVSGEREASPASTHPTTHPHIRHTCQEVTWSLVLLHYQSCTLSSPQCLAPLMTPASSSTAARW